MKIIDFAIGVEKMVDPMAVGKTHYLQTKLSKMPVWLQRKIVTSATKKADKMPFVVEPYAFFLFYEIKNPEEVEKFLPDGFVPIKSRIFVGDEEKYYGIVSMFRLHTSVFWGARAEAYIIARDLKTGFLSWVMMDYVSDTISYDRKHGLKSPDVKKAVMTTTCDGKVANQFKSEDGKKRIECQAELKNAKLKLLDQKTWVEGNTSIAYGRMLGNNNSDLFSLTFMPEEMSQALEVPMEDVEVVKVDYGQGKIEAELDRAVCFPFAQHMLSDSPGRCTHYDNEKALRKAAETVKFDKIKSLSKKN